MKTYLLLIITIVIIGCQSDKESNYLERIYVKENWDHDGILFLAESANVGYISDDSLDFYITKDEKIQAIDLIEIIIEERHAVNDSSEISVDTIYEKKVVFKNYGLVFNNDKISIYTIYKGNNGSKDRSHQFYLRTFDKQHNLIDTILFAAWDDNNSVYISGELTKGLKVKRLNAKREVIAEYQILDNGKIQKNLNKGSR